MIVKDSIWSLKMRVTINGEKMNLFDARDRGLLKAYKKSNWVIGSWPSGMWLRSTSTAPR